VGEQVQIRETWEKEPLGFPTGLAHDRHARRMMVMREFLAFFKLRSPFEPAIVFRVFLSPLHQKLFIFLIFWSFGSMASSSNDPDSLVALRFHDFRVERMRHWWTLLGEDDHADIVGIFGKFPPFMRLQVDRGLLEALASFWDPTHCCFSIGEVDLIPTMEEYAELLQLDSPFSETPVIPIQGPRSNRCLEKYLGLTTAVLRPEIARPEETWQKANISLDLLTKYFSRSAFPAKLARDFIVGKKGWKKFRINAFKIAFAGIFLFPTSAGRIDLGVIPIVFSEGRSIVPAILCETVRSLSYCRRQGEGVPMFCTQLLQLWFCSHCENHDPRVKWASKCDPTDE
jgi:hypothetical protein